MCSKSTCPTAWTFGGVISCPCVSKIFRVGTGFAVLNQNAPLQPVIYASSSLLKLEKVLQV